MKTNEENGEELYKLRLNLRVCVGKLLEMGLTEEDPIIKTARVALDDVRREDWRKVLQGMKL